MVKSLIILLLVGYVYGQAEDCPGFVAPKKPYSVGYGKERWDLILINKAMKALLEAELESMTKCISDELLCKNGDMYPKCLDGTGPFSETITTEKFWIIQALGLHNTLQGLMKLDNAHFNGVSNFEFDFISSTVTIVPLGIEFRFKVKWNDINEFKSDYDVNGLKAGNNIVTGDGDMRVTTENLSFEFIAHKILGGDMDYLQIVPDVTKFEVYFKELCYQNIPMHDATNTKFTPYFLKCDIKYDSVTKQIMDFFNHSLRPDVDGRSKKQESDDILPKIGNCIFKNFPQ